MTDPHFNFAATDPATFAGAARPRTSSGSAVLNHMKPNGVSKATFLAVWLGAALAPGALAGLLIATTGGSSAALDAGAPGRA